MRIVRRMAAVVVILGLAQGAMAEEEAVEELKSTQVPENVRLLLADRDYQQAVTALDEALGKPDAAADYLTYLKARALQLAGNYDEAIGVYESVERNFADSPWARRAKFGRAVSLMRKRNFRSAELIYRDEVEYLLSVERKHEIAGIYLEFADTYFKPPKEDEQPDYQKALEFYGKALEVGPRPEKRIKVQLLIAQCYQHLGNQAEAAKRYQQFTQDHPDSPLDVEARFLLGESQLAQGNKAAARRTWRDLLAKHDESDSERIAEARFQLAVTHGMPQPGSAEDLNLGVGALEAFLKDHPDHKLAAKAHLWIATARMHLGRNEEAVEAIDRFLADERYTGRDEVPDARNLLGLAYQRQKEFTEALAAWRDYLTKHPAHHAWSAVQREIINTEFLQGAEQLEVKQYDQARQLWTAFLAKYPLEGRNPEILYQFGRINHLQEKWDAAISDWRRLVSKYPNTEPSSRGQFMIGVTLEERLERPEDALVEYRKVTWGGFAGPAKQRIARLTARHLVIATERVFRTGETPSIRLTSRNIEKVTVRAYRIDLETYFRKMHLAGGVEGLDIALIDPDHSFEFDVPDYRQYQQTEHAVEIPLPAIGDQAAPHAGVMAVTIGSTTLTATTMVIQSDLDVIVKSSRDEVFVFAQNMRTGKPWPDARLLVSNGQQVFAEGTTGDDGVFQQSYEELKDAEDVRVFAIDEGSVASNVVNLSGVGVAQGLSDKGYVYTDRPAYRAGQMVHVRGILRRASDDAYSIEADKAYKVEVFDSRNRLLRQDDVKLSAFGSFHNHFVLPPGSPSGGYRVLVRDDDGHSYQGAFTVHEYQLEPVRVSIDTDRTVFYRGEKIEGKIKAEFYYGAPLADREIRYQLAGGRVHTGWTDEKGELTFKLPTREYRESQALPMVVTLAERNLRTAKNFYLATQGFSIQVSSVRPVYVSGETFEVTIKANDAEGEPAGRKLTLNVLEQTKVEGRVGERSVEKHELETNEEDGTARVTLRLEKGARYVLRVEGTDRFDNVISGQHLVQVSDDKDKVRLRILADRHTYKVGDTAAVRLHWREDEALALVTFQGARVIDYKLVRLATGSNDLPIPLSAALAPNFELSVAVMTDTRPDEDAKDQSPPLRFHQAASPFTVTRELITKIQRRRKDGAEGPPRPGEEIEVTVTTTDPQGNPVAAEVSLAMIEQSLLDRFGSSVAAIDDFFRGTRREPAVRTTSSITFDYRPKTNPINPRLLAERDRVELAEEEAERLRDFAGASNRSDSFQTFGERDDGGVQPDFDSLVELITETVDAETWGRNQSGESREGQLSLIISQTQQVHEQASGDANGLVVGDFAAAQQPGRAAGTEVPGLRVREVTELSGGFAREERAFGFVLQGSQTIQTMRSGQAATALFDDAARVSHGNYYFARPDGSQLRKFAEEGRREFLVLDDNGTVNQLNLAYLGVDAKKADELARRLSDSGAVILSGLGPQETGYWNPAVVTGEDGKATVTITLPERSTAWRFLAKGVTAETLAGESTEELAVKKELFGDLKLPLAFTDGDTAEITATVHNDVVENGAIEVVLKTTIGGKSVEEKKTLQVTAKGIQEIAFKAVLVRPAGQAAAAAVGGEVEATFELTVAAGERRDVIRRGVPIQPFGMPVYVTSGGSATSDTTAWVEAPADMPFDGQNLEIIIGPSVERSLLEIVLGRAPRCQIDSLSLASGLDTATADLMASIGLLKLLGATRDEGGPQAASLENRVRSSLAQLVSAQNDDGGWSWTGRGGVSNRYSSSRAVWALSLARRAGHAVPQDGFDKAINFLRAQIVASAENDYETKAILLHGLAAAGRGDFTLANRLYRNRPALSTAALLHLTLAFVEMDRRPTAGELLSMVRDRDLDDPATRRRAARAVLPWCHSPAELRSLYALASLALVPEAARTKELIDWLLAHRTGFRWAPEKATGPAALAVSDWFARSRFEGEHYKLAVFVNDYQVKELEIDEGSGTQVVEVPAKLLKDGKQRINFQLTGRGRYTYQCVLGGFVAADKLKSTTPDWRVTRYHQPAPLELDGQQIPRGFGVLQGSYSSFRNPLTELPVGRRGQVELHVRRQNVASGTPEEQLEYLVVREPLPAGTTVIEQSVAGGFERFEITPGAITFYVGTRHYVEPIQFDVHGYLPGKYRAAPTVVRNAYRADQLAVSKTKSLAVLPAGADSADEYRLSPRELFELGSRQFAKGEYQTAGRHLSDLFANWRLKPEVYKQSARMLLDIHLAAGDHAEIVRYFEIIKEKWPELEFSFDKITRVGAAYHEIGEYERSYLVFRATLQSSFLRESGVAGFLESQGEFVRGTDVMNRLLGEYPPEPYVAAATYALAQRVYSKAPQAADDAKLREQKINRVDLVRQALSMLDDFITHYPEDPAADQASYSVAAALLELEAYPTAIQRCSRFAERYPISEYLDSYFYVVGFCHFAQGEHDAALTTCRKVAEMKIRDRQTGRETDSRNKWRSIYIMGQVYHSLGKAAEAIAEYDLVDDRFPDAAQAIEYFARKAISLPEVTTVKPGEPAELALDFRNVPRCDTTVYRIDLMKFSLLNRNLAGITGINLAGIRPYHELALELGDGRDYADRTRKLTLPLDKEGAYLVVCRGENLHASGLVLVTPLEAEVTEEASSGRVRTTIKDTSAGQYVSDVHVKVIGSHNPDFVSGETDLRGVFVADTIQGTSTVIARADDNLYAFFRGTTPLGKPVAAQLEDAASDKSGGQNAAPSAGRKGKAELLDDFFDSNYRIQRDNNEWFKKNIYDNNKQGVQAKEAF